MWMYCDVYMCRHDLKDTERTDLLEQVMSIITGHIYEVIMTSLYL